MDPFGEIFVLDRIRERHQDLMEELQGFTGFQQIRSDLKGIAELLEMIMITGPPVFLLVEFFCFQETGNALDFPEAFRIAGILETTLVTQADVIHHVIEASDDVEGINADLCFGESFLCHGYEAVAHVTAEIFHLSALIGRKLTEVPVKINTGDLVQDVNDCMGIPIGDVAVVFIPVPSVMLRTPDPAVPFEFIYAERFGKAARPSEVDGEYSGRFYTSIPEIGNRRSDVKETALPF